LPRICTVCTHNDREKIDRALAGGEVIRGISRNFRVSEDALSRHKAHVSQAIVKASERREERLGDSLFEEMRRMNRKAWELLGKAESEGDYRGAIVGLREARECIEAQEKMLSRAAEAGGNGGPMFQVAIVYSGRPDTDKETESGPA
jgi:hypothetical protein